MPEIRFDRLKTLADWLMQPQEKLGQDAFYFGNFHAKYGPGELSLLPENFCGTAGCAIGECPWAFPDDWRMDRWGSPELEGRNEGLFDSIQVFFGLDSNQVDWLFYPRASRTSLLVKNLSEVYGGKPLLESATKEEVAGNLYAFIEKLSGDSSHGGKGA